MGRPTVRASWSAVFTGTVSITSQTSDFLVAIARAATANDVTSVTFNGTEQFVHQVTANEPGSDRVEIWTLQYPSATTANVVANAAGAGVQVILVVAVSKAAAGNPVRETASAIGDATPGVTLNVPSIAGGLVIYGTFCNEASSFSGSTLIVGSGSTRACQENSAGSGNDSMTVTADDGNARFALAGIEIGPATSGSFVFTG